MKELTCFKAYDIRGKLGTELDEDIAYRIGRAYGELFSPREVVVGGDVRLTSESLKHAISEGLRDAGADVIDLGLAGTEEVYFATFHLKIDGGIEVTASHNPMDYNGMKLVRSEAKPVSGDSGLDSIKQMAEKNEFSSVIKKRGAYTQHSVLDSYINHLLSYVDLNNFKQPLKIVINSGNGAAGHVVNAIEEKLQSLNVPISLIKVHNEPDGNFPNGIPNPLLPDNRQDTVDAVLHHNADMGVAFDGDFDRCFLFDHQGGFIEGYYIVGLLAEAFLQKNPGQKIIHDPRLTWNTIDLVSKAGGEAILSKTGHAFIKERMRKEDAVYGGEMSAHHYFRDFSYCDSGMIPWLLVAELIAVKQQNLKQLVELRMEAFPSSGEINFVLKHPKEAIEAIAAKYKDEAFNIDSTDGLSLEFPQWRMNLRSSNTEPVVRLNIESKGDHELVASKLSELSSLLNGFK